MLQDRSKFAEQKTAEDEVTQAHEANRGVLPNFCAEGSLLMPVAHKVLVVNQQRCKEQRRFLGHHGRHVARHDRNMTLWIKDWPADINEERADKQECRFQVGYCSNPVYGLRVDWMQGKQKGSNQSGGPALEKLFPGGIDGHHHQGVQENIEQVISKRQISKCLPQQ